MSDSWNIVIWLLGGFGFVFFLLALYALQWAAKDRQFERLDEASRSIYDDEEPEGVVLDQYFKKKKRNALKKES